MKSIIQDKRECYICSRTDNLELHHCIYGRANRKKADKYGLTVWLCPECHRGTYGVHGTKGKEFSEFLKEVAQMRFEKDHTREEWMTIFGRNYREY